MANSKEFVAHVLEMMRPAGTASARARRRDPRHRLFPRAGRGAGEPAGDARVAARRARGVAAREGGESAEDADGAREAGAGHPALAAPVEDENPLGRAARVRDELERRALRLHRADAVAAIAFLPVLGV